MTSTAVSLPPSATPTLVTQQLTFLPPALLTPSAEYQQTPRPDSAQSPMVDQPSASVHHGEPSINITFLLLSGKRKTMGFDQEYTIGKVRQEVFDDWPEGERFYLHIPFHNMLEIVVRTAADCSITSYLSLEWAEETKPPEPAAIRFLHAGRFLEDSELLSNGIRGLDFLVDFQALILAPLSQTGNFLPIRRLLRSYI